MPEPTRILRRPQVENLIGLKRSKLYALMREGAFPRPVRLSAGAVGWRETDIAAWLQSREAA